MNKPIRIQRKRTKGWRMPPNTVNCTRPGKWGNPFVIGELCEIDGIGNFYPFNADAAVRLFEMHILPTLNVSELRGKNLACFCKEGSPCHADILLKAANQ